MIETEGLTFSFEEEDLLRELARFGAGRPSGLCENHAVRPTLTPAAVTWLATFIGTCADIYDVHVGRPPVSNELAMSEEDLSEALAQRAHVADMIVGEHEELSDADRSAVGAWLTNLKRDAEGVGNTPLLNEVFWCGIDAAANRHLEHRVQCASAGFAAPWGGEPSQAA